MIDPCIISSTGLEATMDSSTSSALLSVHKELKGLTKSHEDDTALTVFHHVSDCNEECVSARAKPVVANKKLPTKKSKKRKDAPGNSSTTTGTSGRWTTAEHDAFLRGLSLYGREWKRVAADIPTRTSAQVRSHAQKYFAKITKYESSHTEWYHDNSATTVEPPLPPLSASVQRQAERILSDPASVEAEVRDTLQQLKQRYAELQERLSSQSATSDELIAVDVLRGGLSHHP